jgi:hypothetical protein
MSAEALAPALLAALRWVAGDQPFASSPDSRELWELRRRGLARDAKNGRIEVTGEGWKALASAKD